MSWATNGCLFTHVMLLLPFSHIHFVLNCILLIIQRKTNITCNVLETMQSELIIVYNSYLDVLRKCSVTISNAKPLELMTKAHGCAGTCCPLVTKSSHIFQIIFLNYQNGNTQCGFFFLLLIFSFNFVHIIIHKTHG